MTRLSQTERAELAKECARLHDEGLGPMSIAGRVNRHYRTVVAVMLEYGMVPRSRPRAAKRRKVDEIEREHGMPILEIIDRLRRRGVGQAEAAERLGLSNTHLRDICDRAGVPRLGRNNRNPHKPSAESAKRASDAAVLKTSRMVTLNGVTKTLKEWAECLGITRAQLAGRVDRGWTDEQILKGESPFELGAGRGGRRW